MILIFYLLLYTSNSFADIDLLSTKEILPIYIKDTVPNTSIETAQKVEPIDKIKTVLDESKNKNNVDDNEIKKDLVGQEDIRGEKSITQDEYISHVSAKITQTEDLKSQSSPTIMVINMIKPEKTAYKHWSGTYQPEFTVTVEGQQVGMSAKQTVELKSSNITVTYHAQFPANHSSEDTVTVCIEKNTKTIDIDFDWHTEPRLKITQSS